MHDTQLQTHICRDRQTQIHRQTDKQTGSELHTRTGILTNRHAKSQPQKQTDGQTSRP